MAYHLMSALPPEVDWRRLHDRLAKELRLVEAFPIPKQAAAATDALGLSIPRSASLEAAIEETIRIADVLHRDFGMTFVDLQTSRELTPATAEQFRRDVLD